MKKFEFKYIFDIKERDVITKTFQTRLEAQKYKKELPKSSTGYGYWIYREIL